MKTLNLIFLSILVSSLFASCEKNSPVLFADVDIKVLNKQGANLLSAPAVYNKANIEVYYVVDGRAELYNMPNLDADKGFIIIKGSDGSDAIRVFLNYKKGEPPALTLVKFGDTKIDTIKAEFSFAHGSVMLRKVWFNGIAKPTTFDIVK